MKKDNLKKYLSLNEVTRTLEISRQDLLKLEKEDLLFPELKDDDTKYRYYSLDQIETIKTILKLKEIGLSNIEIKSFLNNKKDKDTLKRIELKEKYIKEAKELFTTSISRNILLKTKELSFTYYYEDRNIFDLSKLNSIVEEIYSHIVEKQLILDIKENVFILLSKNTLTQFNSDNSFTFPLKVRICFPLKKDYQEKNISKITLTKYLEYTSTNSHLLNELLKLKELKEKDTYKFKNEIIYIYNPNNKINDFIINLF